MRVDGKPQRLLPVARAEDLVALALEPERDELENVAIVVGDEDAERRVQLATPG